MGEPSRLAGYQKADSYCSQVSRKYDLSKSRMLMMKKSPAFHFSASVVPLVSFQLRPVHAGVLQ